MLQKWRGLLGVTVVKKDTPCEWSQGVCHIGFRLVVEIQGIRTLKNSCTVKVSEGMVVRTNTPAIRDARKVTLELLLSNHDRKCLTCVRSGNCELQALAEKMQVGDVIYEGTAEDEIDDMGEEDIHYMQEHVDNLPAKKELKEFFSKSIEILKEHKGLVLVEVADHEGDHIKITL